MMHLILKSTSQEDPVQDRWLPREPLSSFHARICARLSPSADRDARWCALDSLWSCDLTFLKDISGKRRRRLREPHIMCRTCDPGWRPLHLFRARLIKPPGGDDELRHQRDLSLYFIIIFWMDYFPIPTLLYLQITQMYFKWKQKLIGLFEKSSWLITKGHFNYGLSALFSVLFFSSLGAFSC